MKDELDGLSDEKLSEAFALEVAGVVKCEMWGPAFHLLAGVQKTDCGHANCHPAQFWPPKYATSAEAVLEHLYKQHWDSAWDKVSCIIRIFKSPRHIRDDGHAWAHALTFPRAACIALLRASRAQKP